MKNPGTVLLLAMVGTFATAFMLQTPNQNQLSEPEYPRALASYGDFASLVAEVDTYRVKRLIGLDEFLQMSQQENVIILDTRSEKLYQAKHIKGAINLSFSDFTHLNLLSTVTPNSTILIYCNNNFKGDQFHFASKVSKPSFGRRKRGSKSNVFSTESQILPFRKPLMLALNIPTFINLYGYGYRNIYELDELVDVNDPRITFEGTSVTTE